MSLPSPLHVTPVEADASGPSHGSLTAMPRTALSALAETNPRYLSAAQRRLLRGLYPEPSASVFGAAGAEREREATDLPRLRTLPELSADEREHALAYARAGASVNALVRGFCLTRWTALLIHREGRRLPHAQAAPGPEQLHEAEQAVPPVTRAREPEPECIHGVGLCTGSCDRPAPAPAPEPEPETLTPEQKLNALVAQFGKAFPNAR